MTDYSELVDRYKKFRQTSRKLNNTLTERISEKALTQCGRKLGLMKGDTFVFGDMDETAILMDYCIHEYSENGQNAVSRYLAESPPASNTDEYTVLKAMSESFYTLVQVAEVLPGVGVQADDLFSDRTYLIIDMGFGSTAVEGLWLATRLLAFADFVTTSGAALVVDEQTLSQILNSVLPRFGCEVGDYIEIDARAHPRSGLVPAVPDELLFPECRLAVLRPRRWPAPGGPAPGAGPAARPRRTPRARGGTAAPGSRASRHRGEACRPSRPARRSRASPAP